MITAQELVSPGGPSAPVWAFLTTIALGIFALLKQQMSAKTEAKVTREEATKARQSAEQAQKNTLNVSNGFTGRVDRNFESVITATQDTQEAVAKLQASFQKHLEWHLEKGHQ